MSSVKTSRRQTDSHHNVRFLQAILTRFPLNRRDQVNVGEVVKQGQPLLVLSAMKMETNVASPANGVVKALHVKEGDSLQGNDIVAEIEV